LNHSLVGRDYLSISSEGHLLIDGIDAVTLVSQFQSPLYVMSGDQLRRNFKKFKTAFESIYDQVLICFAYKANSHIAVCKLLREEGAGAEVASGGELYIALKASVPPEKIVFDGPDKTSEELKMAIEAGVGLINADSTAEIKRISRVATEVGRKVAIGIRVNPDIPADTHEHLATGLRGHKFGIWIGDAFEAYKLASREENIVVTGMLAHIGSSIGEVDPFKESVRRIFDLIGQLHDKLKLDIRLVDLGGGLGVAYSSDRSSASVTEYSHALVSTVKEEALQRNLPLPTLILEPGRAIAADAGFLLTTVGAVKETSRGNWAIVDAGMNLLLRPALYDAYHQILAANKMLAAPVVTYNVGGPCCESSDYLAKDRVMPRLVEGDLLAVLDTGAYGFTMSSHYNSYPKCAVVMIEGGIARVIRSRETYDDLLRHEIP
jgi:diaminopimelate decarboxylase